MKFPIQVQFHRPESAESDNHPTLKAIFHKEEDKPLNPALRDQALRQQSQASRHRLFGELVTWNKNNDPNALNVRLPEILTQSGHICKPTALANLDHYYANLLNLPNIPVRKNHNNFYKTELNKHAKDKVPTISVRQIAKQHGSLQGEILQSGDLEKIAKEMGYSTSILNPGNLQEFSHHVAKQLSKGHPLLTCFLVSQGEEGNAPFGFPSLIRPENEHACLIVGLNTQTNTVNITHWGKTFSSVPISDLYDSMNILPDTRQPEIYKNSNTRPTPHRYKYDLVDAAKIKNLQPDTLRTSITPQENSGFKNRLFVITPDLSHERWG